MTRTDPNQNADGSVRVLNSSDPGAAGREDRRGNSAGTMSPAGPWAPWAGVWKPAAGGGEFLAVGDTTRPGPFDVRRATPPHSA